MAATRPAIGFTSSTGGFTDALQYIIKHIETHCGSFARRVSGPCDTQADEDALQWPGAPRRLGHFYARAVAKSGGSLMQLPNVFDSYSRRARLFPALVAGASLVVAAFVLAPLQNLGLPQLGAGLFSGVLVYVLADLARRRGKRLEHRLYTEWGGKPSTAMLRHADERLDAGSKASYLKFLASKIGAAAPTPQDEANDAAKCDAYYERCGNWLRENTRETKKFKLLFDENVAYGYRRNLLGLKWHGLIIDALIAAAFAAAFWRWLPLDPENGLTVKVGVVGGFAFLHALFMLFIVTKASVREAAVTYARQLLLCCETLHTGRALAKLAGGVAVIRVAGSTEVEVKEKKDRLVHAIHANRRVSRRRHRAGAAVSPAASDGSGRCRVRTRTFRPASTSS